MNRQFFSCPMKNHFSEPIASRKPLVLLRETYDPLMCSGFDKQRTCQFRNALPSVPHSISLGIVSRRTPRRLRVGGQSRQQSTRRKGRWPASRGGIFWPKISIKRTNRIDIVLRRIHLWRDNIDKITTIVVYSVSPLSQEPHRLRESCYFGRWYNLCAVYGHEVEKTD